MTATSGRASTILHTLGLDSESKRGPFKLKAVSLDDDRPPIPLPKPEGPRAQHTLIEQLIINNQYVWRKFMANQFCADGYKSPANKFDDKFRAMSKQDYLYLIEYVRFVNFRSLQEPSAHTEDGLSDMVSDLNKNVKDVQDYFDSCIKDMQINGDDLLEESASTTVLGYSSWEQLCAMTDDAFSNFIRAVPCVYGWNKIAQRLKQEGPGETDTLFYNYWFLQNLDSGSADRLSQFLEDNRSKYESPGSMEKWNAAFRQACLFETAFFKAAQRGDWDQIDKRLRDAL
ncbi:hypothetical protein ARMSODRAFT_1005005 [Armillaria solidipes]|uniref:Thiaminase-2/PQQC domain-containing protein n=1 Tax=Armillaria solidipes TaxID=1076256 RepID=A0A2H3BY42_9AGAR|nr:hypothetical protein ARMSODRAFT_1005005 [Armillaria solidipes]